MATPDWTGYWTRSRFCYFRDVHGWGVRDAQSGKIFATSLTQEVAASLACLLNGDAEHAMSLRDEAIASV